MPALRRLREEMVALHAEKFGTADDLYIGLQLTHSGRFSHPHDDAKLEPVTAYAHPLLDEKFHCSAADVVSDGEIQNIIRHFIDAAKLAQEAGFDFVDIKMAHGYLGHEFLSAWTRPGAYGGSFENRTRFFREIVEGIRREVPGMELGMRFSIFDCLPFEKGKDGVGVPMERGDIGVGHYSFAFGGDGSGLGYDLAEPVRFLELRRYFQRDVVTARRNVTPHEERVEENVRRSRHRIAADCERFQPFRLQKDRVAVRQQCAESLKGGIGPHDQAEFVGVGVGNAVVGFGDEVGAVGEFRRGEVAPVEDGAFNRTLHGGGAGAAERVPLLVQIDSDGVRPVTVAERELRMAAADGVVAEPDRHVELTD